MKKNISRLVAVILMVTLCVTAFAATTKDVISEINSGINVNGTTVNIPSEYRKAAEDFILNAGLTDGELDIILNNVKKGKEIWKASGAKSLSELPANVREELVSLASSTAKAVGATLTISGKSIKVVDKNGKVYSVGSSSSNGGVIKDTGNNSPLVPISISLLILACVAIPVYKKVRK